MLISDQAKDLDKNWFEGGGLHVSFSTAGVNPKSKAVPWLSLTITGLYVYTTSIVQDLGKDCI